MAPGVEIRRFRWEDLEQFTRVHNEVGGMAGTDKAWDVPFMRQVLSQPSCSPEDDCYLVVSGGSLAGFVLIAPEPRIGRTVATAGVLASHRHQGIGRRLVKSAVSHAASLQGAVLHIEAPSDGAEARHILESGRLSTGQVLLEDALGGSASSSGGASGRVRASPF